MAVSPQARIHPPAPTDEHSQALVQSGYSCMRSPAPVCYRRAKMSFQRKGGVPYEDHAHAVAPAMYLASEHLPLIGSDILAIARLEEGRPLHASRPNPLLLFFSLR